MNFLIGIETWSIHSEVSMFDGRRYKMRCQLKLNGEQQLLIDRALEIKNWHRILPQLN